MSAERIDTTGVPAGVTPPSGSLTPPPAGTLTPCFPQGVSFYRDAAGDVWMRWPNPEGGLELQSLQAWMDDNCAPGVDADVIEDAMSGVIITVVLTGPATYSATGTVGRRFRLVRERDVSGVSGIGVVAHGIEFPDGAVAVRWQTPDMPPSTAVWGSVEDVLKVHGHGGPTVVEWID